MKAFDSFDEVILALKAKEIVLIGNNGIPTFFAYVNDSIKVVNTNSNFIISMDDFKTLYSKEKFFEYDHTGNEEIVSAEKDAEYYSWTHK